MIFSSYQNIKIDGWSYRLDPIEKYIEDLREKNFLYRSHIWYLKVKQIVDPFVKHIVDPFVKHIIDLFLRHIVHAKPLVLFNIIISSIRGVSKLITTVQETN